MTKKELFGFGQSLNSLWYNLYAFVQIFIAENGQILKTQFVHLATLITHTKGRSNESSVEVQQVDDDDHFSDFWPI